MQNKNIKFLLGCLLATSCVTTSVNANWVDKMTIGGYGNVNAVSKTDGASGVAKDEATFETEDLDLVLNFNPIDKVRIAMDASFESGVNTGEGRGSLILAYFFMEYTSSNALKYKVGKMFTSFGIYNEIQAAKVSFLTVDRPRNTNYLSRSAGGPNFFPTALTGVSILGNFDVMDGLTYNVTLSNGSNPEGVGPKNNVFESDRDAGKAVTAKSVLSITDSWNIGASFHYETYDVIAFDGISLLSERNLISYGLQSESELTDNLSLELELMGGTYQDTPYTNGNLGATGQKVNRLAYTIMPSYSLSDIDGLEDVTLYARYGFADSDLDNRATSRFTGSVVTTHFGVNYEIFSEGISRMVLKFEYRHVVADGNTMYAAMSKGAMMNTAADISQSLIFNDFILQAAVSF